jgi:transposase-like protein
LGQKYAVNANQIFLWRKQYREGRLDNNTPTKLLPVES